MLFAVLTVTKKFGQAMSIGIVYFALDLIGFKAGSISNPPAALMGVSILYGIVPATLSFAPAFMVRMFQLTPERHAAIRQAMAAGGNNEVAGAIPQQVLGREGGISPPLHRKGGVGGKGGA